LINQFDMSIQLFSKFKRPQQARRGIITERDLDIIEAILRYRLSPTSELVRLVGGNEDVTQRRLRCLWEWGHINRFAFPGIRTHSEFIYYLDRPPVDQAMSNTAGRMRRIYRLEIRPGEAYVAPTECVVHDGAPSTGATMTALFPFVCCACQARRI
jgi:hypothetical protein